MDNAIEKLMSFLKLEENWDGSGAKAFDYETVVNAASFLFTHESMLMTKFKFPLSAPIPGPCHDGSIDLHWSNEKDELLINIKPNPNMVCEFYGDDKKDFKINGTINISNQFCKPFLMFNCCKK